MIVYISKEIRNLNCLSVHIDASYELVCIAMHSYFGRYYCCEAHDSNTEAKAR